MEAHLTECQRRAGLRSRLKVTVDEGQIDPDSRTALFRIFQETLTNVLRHAQATRNEAIA